MPSNKLQNEDLKELMRLASAGNFPVMHWQLMTDEALAIHDYILKLEGRDEKAVERVWHVSCECLPAGAGRGSIVAYHVDGEKRLTVEEIENRLAQLEQARYQIAAQEAAMLEAGLEIEYPWENSDG